MNGEQIKQALKPIADGLFGKQKPVHWEKPHHTVRPIGAMLADLVTVDDGTWGKYAFAREPLRGRVSDEQMAEFTQKANACGRDYAQKVAAQFGTRNPEQLAARMGMKVQYPTMPQNASRVLFAEYREPNNIFIYTDALAKARSVLVEPGVREALGDQLELSRLLLAHELFHWVEDQNAQTIYTHTQKIELWAPKPFHNRSSLVCLGEIAAMAFARELTGLQYSPYVMDVFLVYGYSPEESSGLYEEVMGLAGRPLCEPLAQE